MIGPNNSNLCEIDTKAEYKEAVRRECQTLIGDPPDECPDNLNQWLGELLRMTAKTAEVR